MWGIPQQGEIEYSQLVELDLASVKPSVAGPKRPQDRIELPNLRREFFNAFQRPVAESGFGKPRAELGKVIAVSSDGDYHPGGGTDACVAGKAAAAGQTPPPNAKWF